MSSKSTILTEHHNIQTPCKLFIVGEPQVLLIQPSARHEEKNDGVRREVELIAQASGKGFTCMSYGLKRIEKNSKQNLEKRHK